MLVCSKADCERLKRNFGNFLLSAHQQGWNFEKFIDKSWQVVNHHFDDHTLCGSWCKYRNSPVDDAAKKRRESRFRKKDSKLFKHVKEIYEDMVVPDKMKQCWHTFSCQKNEALNRVMAMFAPKDKTFSMTKQLHYRVHFMVILDTRGHCAGITELFDDLGLSLPIGTLRYLRSLDGSKAYQRQRSKSLEVIKRRSDKKLVGIRKVWTEDQKDKNEGYEYATGMALLDKDGNARVCKWCGGDDHFRMSKRCPEWDNYQKNPNKRKRRV